ncbi:lycopene cyclase domain-containing protein [Carboxylicivirga sp. N1Y90]|uniref:lycopene cyclase domain-containing protein n=1 Tax=Carboxylicivirga fragile TaxID=3417571 RepID=UPI003D335306|nr:lycopene cyclase domain-containing protein [Marinilabiliaceae bacterium N1Y90]
MPFNQHYTYLIIDLACISVPLIASFYRPRPFFKEWRYYFPANLIVSLLFIIWDIIFTDAGIWGFNPDYLTGIYIFNLPLEEVLFFISIPYACVFTWFAISYLIKRNPITVFQKYLSLFFIVLLLTFGIVHINKWYTSITFLITAVILLFFLWKGADLSYVYLSYIFVLPFFFMSNGILTGSIIESPIVWYNHQENMNLRIGTIPAEDSIYGFLLVLLNIELYQFFKLKWTNKKKATE